MWVHAHRDTHAQPALDVGRQQGDVLAAPMVLFALQEPLCGGAPREAALAWEILVMQGPEGGQRPLGRQLQPSGDPLVFRDHGDLVACAGHGASAGHGVGGPHHVGSFGGPPLTPVSSTLCRGQCWHRGLRCSKLPFSLESESRPSLSSGNSRLVLCVGLNAAGWETANSRVLGTHGKGLSYAEAGNRLALASMRPQSRPDKGQGAQTAHPQRVSIHPVCRCQSQDAPAQRAWQPHGESW